MDQTRASSIRISFALMLLVPGASAYADSSTHNGSGTFYNYNGGGNCSFPLPPATTLTAAMNATDYANSAACGGLIEVTNKNTGLSVKVRIDDQCPECAPGNVDLDQEAFALIADLATGIIPISWHYVANSQAGNVKLFFDASSSQWWTAVQVRDHRYPITKLEYRRSGSGSGYTTVARESYNYFIAPSGMGVGPYDFRITDFWGQTIEIGKIPLTAGTELNTGKQFAVYGGAGGSSNTSGSTGGTGTTNTSGSTGGTGTTNTSGSTSNAGSLGSLGSTGNAGSSGSTGGGGGTTTGWPLLLLLGSLLARRFRR